MSVITTDTLTRIASICVVLAGAETLHGIARTALVAPRIGKKLAVKLSIVSGTMLAFAVCYVLVPGVGFTTIAQHLMLGIVLALFMGSFDLAMGKLLLRRSWSKALEDFNPATGNLLVFGLALLVVIPSVVALVRGIV